MPETHSAAILGKTPDTLNYENALTRLHIPHFTTTDPEEAARATHLLLPGGGDITPAFFGQKDHGSRNVDTALDILQFTALSRFVADGKPILGICKGLQLINVHFGGDLFQNIDTADSHKWIGYDQFHRVYHDSLSRRDFFYQLYGFGTRVNSAHHQAVKRLGDDLMTVCRAGDGVIEGLIHRRLPIMAVQWHPERMPDAKGDALLQYFCSLLPLSRAGRSLRKERA
ncbi:MAG: gamma-glutamyl-gamma-aminobutyrate hydrolase family protein [Bacteroidales bacterium]|nr:gamma-glutamyl-gamma-aminobutyrate hydrolase family protein [Bacteroidales bacterium]MCM1416724.1 gamma-glutamyl-gamma-aminobutyrate hydrolase family protein [bacterium]MCM1424117.1 gamma-glutamyl-gamma-aminobutyrate hydrolase family protein [bacterium]